MTTETSAVPYGKREGIRTERIHARPITIIDFETTGLVPGLDRVIEVSIARAEPGEKARLVFDTLINPMRPVSATEVHGITDAAVQRAPRFEEVLGDLLHWLSGSVVTAYNAYFDMRFLASELSRVGLELFPPHFCLMCLRPMLGLGHRCGLRAACREMGIEAFDSHVAGGDVLASADLLVHYLALLAERGINTYDDLSRLKGYAFTESFSRSPLPEPSSLNIPRSGRTFSRFQARQGSEPPVRRPLQEYWEALVVVLADLEVTEAELAYLQEMQARLGLRREQIRGLHSRALIGVLTSFISDEWLDDAEVATLRRFYGCLSKLGWAPGE